MGQEIVTERMGTLSMLFVALLKHAVKIDDEKSLKNDFMNDTFLKRLIGRYSAKMTHEYGDFVGIFKAVVDVGKHVSFEFSSEKEFARSEANKDKGFKDKNYLKEKDV